MLLLVQLLSEFRNVTYKLDVYPQFACATTYVSPSWGGVGKNGTTNCTSIEITAVNIDTSLNYFDAYMVIPGFAGNLQFDFYAGFSCTTIEPIVCSGWQYINVTDWLNSYTIDIPLFGLQQAYDCNTITLNNQYIDPDTKTQPFGYYLYTGCHAQFKFSALDYVVRSKDYLNFTANIIGYDSPVEVLQLDILHTYFTFNMTLAFKRYTISGKVLGLDKCTDLVVTSGSEYNDWNGFYLEEDGVIDGCDYVVTWTYDKFNMWNDPQWNWIWVEVDSTTDYSFYTYDWVEGQIDQGDYPLNLTFKTPIPRKDMTLTIWLSAAGGAFGVLCFGVFLKMGLQLRKMKKSITQGGSDQIASYV